MKAPVSRSWAVSAVLLATTTVAYGAQPPDVVVSDGGANTAMGTNALFSLTTGVSNTAAGYGALYANTTGNNNTASGLSALSENTTGTQNTASGVRALRLNTMGYDNTASGMDAMQSNTTGGNNTASGAYALNSNTTGNDNAASGFGALYSNNIGNDNTADGLDALFTNTSGNYNSALGHEALFLNDAGYRNVAIGYQAGYAVTGNDNITIGAGNQGKAVENQVIRIGNKTYQSKAFMAGISGVKTGLAAAKTVFIDANGQLGTIKSSRIYKEDIHPMGSVSERLFALQPVTFRYKEAYDDGSKPIEFGLIAEDVAEAFPELVVHDAEGKPETVRYDLIATLLLNEFQKEHAELAELKQQVAAMAGVIDQLKHEHMVAATH